MVLIIAIATGGYATPSLFDVAGLLAIIAGCTIVYDLLQTSSALRSKLTLTREFPLTVTVTRARDGFHQLINRSNLALRFQVHEDSYPLVRKELQPGWHYCRRRDSVSLPLSITFSERGEQQLGGAGLRVIAGLGFWVLQYRFNWDSVARVYPLIEELTKGDLFAHRRRLWGIGQHQSRKFGRGTEFDRLRDYTPDDEFRTINWKATARAGKPVVNQFQVEQCRDLMLLIDCGRLMHTEIGGRPRLDRYLDAAIHLAYVALSQKDRVGLIAFDQSIRGFVKPGRRPRQLDDLINAMFDLKPRFVESDYAMAVTTLKAHQPKRGLVVLFTDLVDSVSSRRAVANLARLARTHLPVVVILDDPQIAKLADRPPQEPMDAYVRAAAEQFIAEKKHTLGYLRKGGCMIVNVTAEKVNTSVVDKYLQVKARDLL